MTVPFNIETLKLQFFLLDRKPSRDLSVEIPIPKFRKAWNFRHKAERHTHVGYQPVLLHIRLETRYWVRTTLDRKSKMRSQICVSPVTEKPRIQVLCRKSELSSTTLPDRLHHRLPFDARSVLSRNGGNWLKRSRPRRSHHEDPLISRNTAPKDCADDQGQNNHQEKTTANTEALV